MEPMTVALPTAEQDQADPQVAQLLLAAYLDQHDQCVELIASGVVSVDASARGDTLAPYKRLRGGKKKQVRPLPSDSPQLPLHRYAGRTALSLAVEAGHLATARRLLACGASADAADSAGVSPLDLALERAALADEAGAGRDAALVEVLSAASRRGPRGVPTARQAVEQRALREAAHMRRVQACDAARRQAAVEAGLARISGLYRPLHASVYEPPADSFVDAAGVQQSASVPGLVIAPVLDPHFAATVWEELAHYEAAAQEMGLPFHERFDQNMDMLEICGFASLCERIHDAVAPLWPLIGIDDDPPPRFMHAVRLDNYPGRPGADRLALKVHQDKYRLTINVCLLASHDLAGSTVGFYYDGDGAAAGGTRAAGGRGVPSEAQPRVHALAPSWVCSNSFRLRLAQDRSDHKRQTRLSNIVGQLGEDEEEKDRDREEEETVGPFTWFVPHALCRMRRGSANHESPRLHIVVC
ncbi:unnamed protein product [Prorocentrum cordatum]|uniref:Prolyl 4-hydroxylase alpha subunit domain-containing protein n=1 Tax=Prorocentrum cordatum TaxID=2364126 RepID=A0ABN9XCT0_9DINO|nr:unnamed protein product [Polarella glacialis]